MPDIKVKVQEPTQVETLVNPQQSLRVNIPDSIVVREGAGVSINEMLTGIDGVNVLFQATYPFESVLVGVYLNGLKLSPSHYSVVLPDKIQLDDAPLPGDILEIDYIK